MSEFVSGPTMVLQWIWSGGTVSLAADYQACKWSPSTDYAETTAGSDTNKGRLATIKDAKADVTLVGPTSTTGGTSYAAALAPGVGGTLIIGPEGTATGKRKITFPCFSDGLATDFPYNDICMITDSFTGNGSFTDGSY